MLYLKKISTCLATDSHRKILSYLVLYCCSWLTYAESINMDSDKVHIKSGYYYLDKMLDIPLTKEVHEALEHGISIEIHTQFELSINRKWLWDKRIKDLLLAYELKYQPLTKDYLITNLSTGVKRTYNSINVALNYITSIKKIALFHTDILQSGEQYTARIRVYIDLDSLPSLLQTKAYFSPDWDISSQWYTWSINP